MKRISFVICFLGAVFINRTLAQDANPVIPDPHVVGPLPNAASLGKYGDVPIGLYTGTLEYHLPVTTLQTKHLSVPISLDYSTNGVKVDEQDSKVGISWAMSAGGVITRTVYGMGRTFGGGVPPAPPANGYYPNCTNPSALSNWAGYYQQTDTQLDEFNFNFNGYSGKFVLTSSGGVYTATQMQYSNLKIEYNSGAAGTDWIFRITTPDGVAYYFGENYATEVTNTFTSGIGISASDSYPPSQVSAFFLTRIIHPYDAADNITFYYSNHSNNYTASVTAFLRFLDSNSPCSTEGWCPSCNSSTGACAYGGPDRWAGGYESYGVTANQGSALRLDSILTPYYGKIKFTYIEKQANSQGNGADCLLNGIAVYSPYNQRLKSWVIDYYISVGGLNYSNNLYPDGVPTGDPRAFLIDVKENDANNSQVNITKFDYNDVDNMAPRLSFSQDAYGYFNGQQNFRFIPYADPFQSANNLPVADRDPNFTYAVKGTLSKITYPTGGYSSFTYEPHSASIGGVRIKEVDTYDPSSNVTAVKTYTYSDPITRFAPVFKSSDPHKNNVWAATGCYAVVPPTLCSYIVLTSSSLTPLSGRGGFLAYYSQVTETDGTNGGIEHYYKNDPLNPLNLLQGIAIYGITAPAYNWKWAEETNTNYFKMVSGSKVYVKKIANNWYTDPSKNTLFTEYAIKREDYNGLLNPAGPDDPAADAQFTLSAYDIISMTHQQQWNYISSTTTTDYDINGSNPIAKTVNYFYDNPTHAMLTRTETTGSKGEALQEVDKYVGDQASISNLTTSETNAINALQGQYRVATLLEKDENNNGSLVNRIHNGYNVWSSSMILPQTFRIQIAGNAMETRLNYQAYDLTNGNLLQYQKANGPAKSYQWNYNLQYPEAEVINAPVNDIFYDSFEGGNGDSYYNDAKSGHYSYTGNTVYSKSLTGLDVGAYTLTYWLKPPGGSWAMHTSSVTVSGNPYTINLTGQIDDVRFYPAGAQMTTYTYDPLIGITTSTDAKGEISFYEYDASLRLLNIKDKDGNITKSFCYNYAGQSVGCAVTPIAETAQTLPITISNTTGSPYQVNFSNGSTNLTFDFSNNGSAPINVPAGLYAVSIFPPGGLVYRTITLGTRPIQNAPRGNFNDVNVQVGTADFTVPFNISIQ